MPKRFGLSVLAGIRLPETAAIGKEPKRQFPKGRTGVANFAGPLHPSLGLRFQQQVVIEID